MILSEVRDYLQQRGLASLSDISVRFDADPEAVRGMLDIWVRKGRIYKRMATDSCGSSCNQCNSAATELYFWGGTQEVPVNLPLGCAQDD